MLRTSESESVGERTHARKFFHRAYQVLDRWLG